MSKTSRPLALLAVALLGLGVAACGGAGKGAGSASHGSSASVAASGAANTASGSTPASGGSFIGDEDDDDTRSNYLDSTKYDNDADFDDDRKRPVGYRDSDDGQVVAYGRAASGADKRTLTGIVERYYAAAAAADGRAACSLIAPAFARTIPEDYGGERGPGPAYARGKTCPTVMSLLFKHEHPKLSGAIKVTGVRVKGNEALVLLGSRMVPASYLALERQRGGAWRVVGLLTVVLP